MNFVHARRGRRSPRVRFHRHSVARVARRSSCDDQSRRGALSSRARSRRAAQALPWLGELVSDPPVEVDVGRRDRDERHRHRVDQAGDHVDEPERRVRREDQQRADDGAKGDRERCPDHDQRRDLQPGAPNEEAASSQPGERIEVLQLDARRDQGPAAGEPDGDRDQVDRADEQRDDGGRNQERAEERTDAVRGEHVGAQRSDLATLVELDEGSRRRCLRETQAEQRQRSADRQHEEAEQAARPAAGLEAENVGPVHDQRLQERRQQRDRDEQHADPEHQSRFGDVDARRRREGLAPRAPAREAKRGDGAPRGAREGVQEQEQRERRRATG